HILPPFPYTTLFRSTDTRGLRDTSRPDRTRTQLPAKPADAEIRLSNVRYRDQLHLFRRGRRVSLSRLRLSGRRVRQIRLSLFARGGPRHPDYLYCYPPGWVRNG